MRSGRALPRYVLGEVGDFGECRWGRAPGGICISRSSVDIFVRVVRSGFVFAATDMVALCVTGDVGLASDTKRAVRCPA